MRLTALVEEEKKVALSRPLGVAFMTLGQLLFYHDFIRYKYIIFCMLFDFIRYIYIYI